LTTAKEYLSPQTTPNEQDRVMAKTETTGAKVFSQVMTDVVSTRPSVSSLSEPFRLHKEMGSVHTKMAASS